MNIGRILFFAIFLLSSSTLLATTSIINEINYTTFTNITDTESNKMLLKQAELKKEYQQQVLKVLQNYSSEDKMKNLKEGVNSLELELLNLSAPKQYKDLHFKLISSLDDVKDGNKSAIYKTKTSLESIIKDFSWLASTLSIFIINNFS